MCWIKNSDNGSEICKSSQVNVGIVKEKRKKRRGFHVCTYDRRASMVQAHRQGFGTEHMCNEKLKKGDFPSNMLFQHRTAHVIPEVCSTVLQDELAGNSDPCHLPAWWLGVGFYEKTQLKPPNPLIGCWNAGSRDGLYMGRRHRCGDQKREPAGDGQRRKNGLG